MDSLPDIMADLEQQAADESLRVRLTAAALAGLLASDTDWSRSRGAVAEEAVRHADATIKALREVKPNG